MEIKHVGAIYATRLIPQDVKQTVKRTTSYELICGHITELVTPAAADEEFLWCERCVQWTMVSPKGRAVIRRSPVKVHPDKHFANRGQGSKPGQPKKKLTEDVVREIRRLHAVGAVKQIDIARRFGVNRSTVYGVISGRIWKEVV